MFEHQQMTAIRAFNDKHGDSYSSGSQVYYADGSVREIAAWGAMWDSSEADQSQADLEWQVQSNIVQFFRLKLADAVAQFDGLNTRLQFSTPDDPDAEIAELKRLQFLVMERKKELARAEEALANTQFGRATRQRREAAQERDEKNAEFHRRRRAIRI
jgi:hypothetical protein